MEMYDDGDVWSESMDGAPSNPYEPLWVELSDIWELKSQMNLFQPNSKQTSNKQTS